MHVKNIKFCAREKWFSSREKNEKTAREKKKRGREKSEKWAKKWAWKTKTAREKNQKNAKNRFHGHFLFSREKKTLPLNPGILLLRESLFEVFSLSFLYFFIWEGVPPW